MPTQLRDQLLKESHRGMYSGHFSGNRLYNTLVRYWWWPGMYKDAMAFCKKSPEFAIVTGAGRQHRDRSRLFAWISWTYLVLNKATDML